MMFQSLISALISALIAAVFAAAVSPAMAQTGPAPAAEPLFDTVSRLDTEVFAAFNACVDPAQLDKHAGYFAADVEFYHDTGGVTWTRDAMIANTKRYVCGHFRRERVPGALQVFAVKDFGAIARGSHRFCQFDTKSCDGIAEFVMVWANKDGAWKITRVLSYGHRAAK